MSLEYYQPAFEWLSRTQDEAIKYALLQHPSEIRRRHFAKYDIGFELAGSDGHAELKTYLDMVEASMRAILQQHSVQFWLHVYRRIAPWLHPSHENRTDKTTTRLVRDTVECAICKHGKLGGASELFRSVNAAPSQILGGLFMRRLKKTLRDRAAREQYIQQLRDSDQLVIRDFRPSDLTNMYGLEGLAYEYWLTTARMRSIGKGARQVIQPDGGYEQIIGDELGSLIRSYDTRIEQGTLLSTLAGSFVGTMHSGETAAGNIFTPIYNVEGAHANELFEGFGLRLQSGSSAPILNFLPTTQSINGFVQAHNFLSSQFAAARGYSLACYLLVTAALSWRVALPERQLRKALEGDNSAAGFAFLNALRRAYITTGPGLEAIRDSISWYIEHWVGGFGSTPTPTDNEIEKVLSDVTLDAGSKQSTISLWSRGPRFSVIRADDCALVDAQGIGQQLGTLFVRLRHSPEKRGMAFEESLRQELAARGFDLVQRHFEFANGAREVDAAVRIGSTLWLIEAHSMERPLDYELGRPDVIERRNERFAEKLLQVTSVRKCLEANTTGENYDFSWATEVQHCVVSPFVEWIWSRDSRFWVTPSLPRIMSVAELLRTLE